MLKARISRAVLILAVGMAAVVSAPTPVGNAQSNGKTEIPFPQYMNSKKTLAPPYMSTDKVPIVRGDKTSHIPGSDLATTIGSQELQNKSFDCSKNTCVNFPGIPYSAIPDCADTGGKHLNFTGGAFFCGTSGGGGGGGGSGMILVNAAGELLLNGSGDILLN